MSDLAERIEREYELGVKLESYQDELKHDYHSEYDLVKERLYPSYERKHLSTRDLRALLGEAEPYVPAPLSRGRRILDWFKEWATSSAIIAFFLIFVTAVSTPDLPQSMFLWGLGVVLGGWTALLLAMTANDARKRRRRGLERG